MRWVAVCDIDEYIVPTQGSQSFRDLLKRYSRFSLKSISPFKQHRLVGSLKFHWLVFGTSNVRDIDTKKELLTEKLYLRAPDGHVWHEHIKCIYRPEAIKVCLIHEAHLMKKYKSKNLAISDFRIHRYWSGSQKRFLEKRGSKENLSAFEEEFNRVEDKTIFKLIQPLKAQFYQ